MVEPVGDGDGEGCVLFFPCPPPYPLVGAYLMEPREVFGFLPRLQADVGGDRDISQAQGCVMNLAEIAAASIAADGLEELVGPRRQAARNVIHASLFHVV